MDASALPTNPMHRIASDLRAEHRADVPYPPGELGFSLPRTMRVVREPLPLLLLLLGSYARYGPVFSLRVLHHAGRLHDRCGSEPLHDGRPRRPVPLG